MPAASVRSSDKKNISLRRPSRSCVSNITMSRVVVAVASCLLSASLVLAAPEARAQERSPSAADALFESAREAMARGDFSTACPRFAESHRLDPAPGTLLNLAQCEENEGKLASSYAHLVEAIETLPAGDFRLDYARERLAALKPRVPTVTLTLAQGSSAARVFRDDLELREGSFGVPLPLDPGQYTFVVRADGRIDAREELTLTEGQQATLTLTVGPEAPAPSRASTASRPRALAYASLGVGGAGVVAGVVTGLLFANAASTYEAHCDALGCDDEGLRAASRGKTLNIVSPVAFGVGAAGLAAGVYLLLRSPTTSAAGARQGAVTLSPEVGPRVAGLSLSGGF